MERQIKFQSSMLWAIASIIFGGLLIYWQKDFLSLLVIIMGWTAIAISAIQFLIFLSQTRGMEKRWSRIPFSIIISLLIGLLLVFNAAILVDISIKIMGIVMILLSISQLISLAKSRKIGYTVNGAFFIYPILLLGAGCFVVAYTDITASWLVIFAGISIITYGIAEIFAYFAIRKLSNRQ